MTLKYKIYIALAIAGLISIAVVGSSLHARSTERRIERSIEAAKKDASMAEKAAREFEMRAGEYKRKIEYLEDSLAGLRSIATKQNEELKRIEKTTDSARLNVSRARAVRSLESTTSELCAELAALGHPCE